MISILQSFHRDRHVCAAYVWMNDCEERAPMWRMAVFGLWDYSSLSSYCWYFSPSSSWYMMNMYCYSNLKNVFKQREWIWKQMRTSWLITSDIYIWFCGSIKQKFKGAPGSPQTPRVASSAQAELSSHGTGWRGEAQARSPWDPEGLPHWLGGQQIRW